MQQPDAIPAVYPFARSDALNIQLLGACRIIDGERVSEPSSWKLRKAAQIVKQLALAPGRQLHRDQIFENLWPELDPGATSNLRVTLHFARKLLTQDGFDGASAIQSRGQQLTLFPDRNVWTDVQAFEEAAAAARAAADPSLYRAALDLYTGDLLPEDRFDDWASYHRESMLSTRIDLLLELAWLHERLNDIDPAVRSLRDVLDVDMANEQAHAALIRVYASSGRRVQALRQYQRLREALQHTLDVEPDPAVTGFYESLLTHQTAVPVRRELDEPADTQPLEPARTNLPVQRTSFVGRHDALPAIHDAIERSRLVTLAGPAGAGKTRLAIEAATRLATSCPGGIWFVDLSTLHEPALIAHAIAATLGTHEIPGQPLLETLSAALSPLSVLLVLDNCEHLIDACAITATTLLLQCPRLRIVATSREPLRIDGEAVWPVPPLGVPAPENAESLHVLRDVEAVRLFIERARMASPGFMLTNANRAAIADICRKLEGMPLTIELAATRARGMAVEQIAARLGDALGLLSGGNRLRPTRQQSLRAAIEWSHDLLSPDEQRLFARLSVFAGSITLEAIESVCVLPDDETHDTLNPLFALIDKSLLAVEEHAEQTRYRMLETIRQFAAEKLEQSGSEALIRHRRRAWYLALAARAEQGLIRADVQLWMQQLAPEIDSIRLVLQQSLHDGDRETLLRLASQLWAFWLISGRMGEGRTWLEPALGGLGNDSVSAGTRTRALAAAGLLAQRQGDYRQAVIWTEECLPLARGIDDRLSMAYALTNLCQCALYCGEVDRTTGLALEGLAMSREIGMLAGVPTFLSSLGLAEHWRGDHDSASHYLDQAISSAREIGFDAFAAWLLGQRAEVDRVRGDAASARLYAEESIALGRSVGDTYGPALGRRVLGHLAADAGDLAEATVLVTESLATFRRLGYKLRTIECLEDLGELALRHAHAHDAARLLSAAEQLRASEGSPPPPFRLAHLNHAKAQSRERLGDCGYAAIQASAYAMTLDEAVEHALVGTA